MRNPNTPFLLGYNVNSFRSLSKLYNLPVKKLHRINFRFVFFIAIIKILSNYKLSTEMTLISIILFKVFIITAKKLNNTIL